MKTPPVHPRAADAVLELCEAAGAIVIATDGADHLQHHRTAVFSALRQILDTQAIMSLRFAAAANPMRRAAASASGIPTTKRNA